MKGHALTNAHHRLTIAAAAWVATTTPAFAQARDSEETAKLILFICVGLGGLLLGILLYHASQRTSQVPFKGEGQDPAAGANPRELVPAILGQLAQLSASPEQREQVARSVSDVVLKTVEERVVQAKKQLNEQYGHIIEEKRRSEAVLQRKYQEVLTEKKQTTSVLESIAEGLVVVNNKGEVVMMNPAAQRLLAVDQKDRIGKPLTDGLKDGQLISLSQGANEDREIVLSAHDESTKRVLRASNAVITDEDGKTVGMVAVLSDVTKQRELDQLKSEFVSKVSHELRTPLIAMQHALSILSDEVAGPLAEEQQKFVSLTQRNLQRLNVLINDLLDLSKLEARKMDLRLEDAQFGPLIQHVCETVEAWAQSKTITLTRRVPSDLPTVHCDPGRVTQVLTNLIGNAVKFTPKQGRVIVEAKLVNAGAAVDVSVSDTGVGIAKEDLPKLFSKFQQVGERSATDISGTGLGLAISKEIIELHHGRIWAESEGGKGAKFSFTLPLRPPDPPAA